MQIKTKLIDWKNRLKDRHMLTPAVIIIILLAVAIALGIYTYKNQRKYRLASENEYNMAFSELISYMEEVETYLAKATISSTPEHGAETLANVWREADLAGVYLAMLPINNEGLSNTQKFLNQVSDYSYSLSMKAINGEELTEEELNNLEQMHEYAVSLKTTLNQLESEINDGSIKWGELEKEGTKAFAQQVDNIQADSFKNIESTFDDYTGLIYDGAFSEHMTSTERKGLTGDDISEEEAKQIIKEFTGADDAEISSNGLSENGNIESYTFLVKKQENSKSIAISKKGGHIVYMNYYREIKGETINEEEAVQIGKNFLEEKGYTSMKETYYMKQEGTLVINFAYNQGDVVVYPDLIKVKIALDNGEVLGMESAGYLNCHTERNIEKNIITVDKAKQNLNKKINIESERLAIIPTKYNTEILCWEFTGKVGDKDFLVYINAKTGKEEDILMIVNTPNGTLTT